ncbi:MAG: 3-hydroxyacyl-CoA dehydrogenase [Magnetovibrio sp.]|nr:3-hydroxyacyl-CoA dehydrogenase [Magnetovibrio sp.]
MTIDPNSDDLILGVAGAGAMGRGIVQVAAAGGCRVKLFDTNADAAKEAVGFIDKMLKRNVEKGRMAAEDAETAVANIEFVTSIADFAPCQIVIEAVIENLDVKHVVFKEIEAAVSDETIIASNTSSLSVTTIAAACEKPERVAGMHFFNPVPLMKLVEVIEGVRTGPGVADALMDLGKRMTRTPVLVKDAPGFLVNQVGRGYNIECAHIVSDGVAEFADVDRICRDAVGFRMGPFELMDLTAVDVTHPATELIYSQFYHEARYRPATLMQMQLDAGLYGRKVGQGFYRYTDGKAEIAEEAPAPAFDGRPVWISRAEPDAAAKLVAIVEAAGANLETGDQPSAEALILVTPIGGDATDCAVSEGLDATRVIAVDTVFGLEKRRTLMKTAVTRADVADAAHGLLGGGEVPATVIGDTPGFIAQRAVAAICNIGCAVAQARTAAPDDIDMAVVLALNYPMGPLAFGDSIGPATVLKILRNIHRLTGDPRYRPTPWLRRRAELGVSLTTSES